MQAIILSIGDELVLGQTVDTNTAWLAERLSRLGISTRYHQTLADDREAVAAAIVLALRQARIVLITGGLGPTEDDLTRQALADAIEQPLVTDEASLQQIEAFFAQRGRPMPPQNRSQAKLPRGASAIPNPNGTAPGICAIHHGVSIYVMPGVPREMFAMYTNSVEPDLHGLSGGRHIILTTKLNTFGSGESTVAEKLAELMDRKRNPKVGTTVSDGIVSVRIRSEFGTTEEAERNLQNTVEQVNQRLGPIVFGRDDQTLQDAVVPLLERRGQRLVTAESCTGGAVGQMITQVTGASNVYMGGWVTYDNVMKIEQLGVDRETLQRDGAVSESVVRAMAEGALRNCKPANVSLAVTGIAGPGGGTKDKPVGTVWLALGARDMRDTSLVTVQTARVQLPGDRDSIRDRSAKCLLQMLRLHLLNEPLEHLSWAQKSEGRS